MLGQLNMKVLVSTMDKQLTTEQKLGFAFFKS